MAASSIANIVKSSLGPVGLDKMLVDDVGDVTITNDGATILQLLEVEHPAAKVLVELAALQDEEVNKSKQLFFMATKNVFFKKKFIFVHAQVYTGKSGSLSLSKGSEDVILSDPSFLEWHVRFTMVPKSLIVDHFQLDIVICKWLADADLCTETTEEIVGFRYLSS